jgi:hypothetical protein
MSILKVNVTPVAPADTTAPVLSDLTAAASGATGWTGSVVMDEPGPLYYLVSTNASENAATVKAGSSVSVTQAGSVALNGTGLTAETTYYLHVLGADDEDTPNESAVSSSDSFTTEATGSATGTVTISSFRQNNLTVAPFAVTFEARVTGATVTENLTRSADDPSYDGLVYIWDFGEGGAKTVNSNAVNLPSAWNNMNVAYGKRPAHVYETPGTYTVTCTCRELDGTLVGTDTFQVTVQDPDDVFTGSRTILVGSADANYPGATVTGSFSTAWNTLKGLGQSGRILVARGSDLTVGVNLTTSNANQNVYVGAYGSGADPILRTGSSGANETPMFAAWAGFNSDFTFWNLDLRGNWDSTNETGRPYQGVVFSMDGNSTKRLTISDCSFGGFAINVRHDGNTANTSIMSTVHKSNITNWQNYGVFVIQNYNGCFNIIGGAIHQDENAMMGGGLKNVDRNDHGPVRMSYPGYCYVACCDFFSRNTWTEDLSSQPCLRMVTKPDYPSFRANFTVERCSFESGGDTFVTNHTDGNATKHPVNGLYDKILSVTTTVSRNAGSIAVPGVTVRNMLAYHPAVSMYVFGGFKGFINVSNSDIEVYSCTFVSASGALWPGSTPTNSNVANSRTESLDLDSTDMVTIGGTWTSRWLGIKNQATSLRAAQLTMNTATAPPAGIVNTGIPNVSSPLVNDATGKSAYDDFYGTVRSNADRGAVERT